MKQPLAFRVRPTQLDEIIGQQHLFGQDGLLRNMIVKDSIQSMIFFGPPGCGKTTSAIFLANYLKRPYRLFNAVTGNKKDLDAIYLEAQMSNGLILIMDEVHRLNKDKQDTLLPYLEDGLITLIGATTSNPLFAINPAIRSRAFLIEFKRLSGDEIKQIIVNAINHPQGFNGEIKIEDAALEALSKNANGDTRYALNILELAAINVDDQKTITLEQLNRMALMLNVSFAKDGDDYYNTLSGFQKSIRGSDVNGALYYLAILIKGNDLVSIERRLLTIAYEDIGLANPNLVSRVLNAIESAKRVGFPEGRIMLANVVIELALSPKSRSANNAIDAALSTIDKTTYPMPDYLKLTPVNLKDEDKYDYGNRKSWPHIQYLPDAIKNIEFYVPQNLNSAEKTLAENYEVLKKLKRTNRLKSLKNKQTNSE